jgi:ion channel-forming bestrophin family protein
MPFRDTILPFASSRTLGYVALMAMAMGVYSVLPVLKENSSFKDIGDVPSDMHAALSLVLGALLVFRTNTAYSRWWEARTLWGSLVNASRNLSVKLSCLVSLSNDEARFFETQIAAFPRLLMEHLRICSFPNPVPASINGQHHPMQTVQSIYQRLNVKRKRDELDSIVLRLIDAELSKYMEVCGACERIAKTPFVRSYRIFVRQCIFLFLLSFPWGVAQDFQWWTVLLTVTIAYFMLGMEVVAEHVEEPFGLNEDDLDLEGLCKTIAQSVREVFSNEASMTPTES